MKMSEPQRIKGWFYFPEFPSGRVPGVLTWMPDDGAILELIGGLSPGPGYQRTDTGGLVASEAAGEARSGTLFGESDSGQAITLWDARCGSYTTGFFDRTHEELWHSSWICTGAHLSSPLETVVRRAVVTVDELYYLTVDGRFCAPQWAKIEGVEHAGERQPDGTRLMPYIFPVIGGYRAEYARGESGGTRYSVATTATQPWVSAATEAMPDLKLQMMTKNLRRGQVVELSVGASAAIELVGSGFESTAAFVDRIAPINDLVRLATFDACGIEQVVLETARETSVSLLMHTGDIARPSDVHEPTGMVFTLADVSLQSYLEARERLTDGDQARYAWSVVVGLCGYSSRIVEEYVGQALAAAEGFHRWCLKGEDNVSLNGRLKGLHRRLDPEVRAVLGLEVEQWARWAVWARNHVAHGGTKNWRQLRDSLQLYVVAESVHLVTYLAALQEFDVPSTKILEALLNHPRLRQLAERSAEVSRLPPAP
jgi:hypothetical protein